MNSQIDGFNCWEVALELGGFTMKLLHADLYDNKFSLCGGEELNGFELWRNLEIQYGGAGKEVEVTGLTRFMTFPPCKTEAGLLQHLNSWEEYLNKYGAELRKTPATLRTLLINILPKDLAEKLRIKRVKYPTFQSILQYCRDRLEEQRELHKAEVLHSRRSDKVHAVTETHEVSKDAPPPPQPPTPAVSPSTGIATLEELGNMILAMGQKGAARKPDRKPRDPEANLYKTLIVRGCWECGVQDHSRHECPKM